MHREVRARFLDLLSQEDACALIPTGTPPTRNNDCEYLFRPHSDFFYLTGFREPDSVLLLLSRNEELSTVLFLRERNPKDETWTGRRLGTERAAEALGVDAAYDIDEMWERLPELLKGHRRLVYRLGDDEARDRDLIQIVGDLRRMARAGTVAPTEWVDPDPSLHELRLIKTKAEEQLMRKAAAITAEAHVAAMAAAQPGVNECEIDALIGYTFQRHGSPGSAYSNIVAGGENACILHYVENNQPLRAGDLLLIDAGCEWEYYASDVTRTFPVSGTFSEEQRALYSVVLEAQKAAIAVTKPGVTFETLHRTALAKLVEGLVDLGLLEGSVEELIEDKAYSRFYMHSTSHWLGLDVHDCGTYWSKTGSRPLEVGMVLTVEPGLYIAVDDETVDERWRGIGIRIEDDLLVTENGHDVLSDAIPKEIDEVEAACRGRELQRN